MANLFKKMREAGRRAEEQMAYYLSLGFFDDSDVTIFNNIRLFKDGNLIQIDHLIIHKYGMVIVESKGVADRIIIDQNLQWIREYRGEKKGIRSPVIQAEIQAQELCWHFSRNISLTTSLSEIDCVVAISDNGIIESYAAGALDNVMKADQVCGYIKILIQKRKNKLGKIDVPLRIQEAIFNLRREYINWCINIEDLLRKKELPLSGDKDENSFWTELWIDFLEMDCESVERRWESFYYYVVPRGLFKEQIKEVHDWRMLKVNEARLRLASSAPAVVKKRRLSEG